MKKILFLGLLISGVMFSSHVQACTLTDIMEEDLRYYKNKPKSPSTENLLRWQMQMYKNTINERWNVPLDRSKFQ